MPGGSKPRKAEGGATAPLPALDTKKAAVASTPGGALASHEGEAEDLRTRVRDALEGDHAPRVVRTKAGPLEVSSAKFVDWCLNIERTGSAAAFEAIALISQAVFGIAGEMRVASQGRDVALAERRVLDDWKRALLEAATARTVTPRDPVTQLPLDAVPGDLHEWAISLADLDCFVKDRGMPWTFSDVARHFINEAKGELAREAGRIADHVNVEVAATFPEEAGTQQPTRAGAHQPKLTPDQDREIAERYARHESVASLAKLYGVDRQTIDKSLGRSGKKIVRPRAK